MADSTIGLRCLVLSPDYSPCTMFPISTIPVEEAIVRVLKGNAILVKEYQRKILTPSRNDLYWPSIIVNKEFYKRHNDPRLKSSTLFYRDHGMCQYCEKPLTENNITCDHVMPTSKGGSNSWENVVACCEYCNLKKADQLPKGVWVPKNKPYKPSIYQLIENRKKFPIIVDDYNWIEYMGGWDGKVHESHVARKVKDDLGII